MLSPTSLAASRFAIFLPSTFAVLSSVRHLDGRNDLVDISRLRVVVRFDRLAVLAFCGCLLVVGDVSSIRLSNGDSAQSDDTGRGAYER